MKTAAILIAAAALQLAAAASAQSITYTVEGDGIPQALTSTPGNAARGKQLLAQREAANCLKCHRISDKALAGGGDKGPSLDGVGAALSAAQLRLTVADPTRVSHKAQMPSFYKAGGDAPKLAAQDIEDIVAYLRTLKH